MRSNRAWRLLVADLMAFAVVAAIFYGFRPSLAMWRISSHSFPVSADPLVPPKVEVQWTQPSTDPPILRIKSTKLPERATDTFVLFLPDLEVRRDLTGAQLAEGQSIELPNRPGSFRAILLWKGFELAENRVTIPLHEVLSSDVLSFKISFGTAQFTRPAKWLLPIRLDACSRTAEGDELPARVPTRREFSISTVSGEGPADTIAQILEGATTSQWFSVPFSPKEPTVVRVADAKTNSPILSASIQWGDHAPKFALKLFPPAAQALAFAGREAKFWAFYEVDGVRIPFVSEIEMAVSITGDPNAVVRSENPALLGPQTEQAEVRVGHIGFGGDSTLSVQDPLTGAVTTASIHFVFPWLVLGVAAIAGAIGVLVSTLLVERSATELRSGTLLVLRALCGAAGGVTAFLTFALAWAPYPGKSDPDSVLAGMLVGVLGGYGGTAIFDLGLVLLGLVRREPPRPVPPPPQSL